jgi:DNA-binding transcriptional MerR regulator
MKIGDLARATGVSTRLLRYYEEQGLITPYRTGSGHRVYGHDAVDHVRHIRDLLAAGLSTSAIRELLPCVEGPGPPCSTVPRRCWPRTSRAWTTGSRPCRRPGPPWPIW